MPGSGVGVGIGSGSPLGTTSGSGSPGVVVMRRPYPWPFPTCASGRTLGARPLGDEPQTSKRSCSMTFAHARTKSWTNFSPASSLA